MINDCSASLTDTATTKTPERHTKKTNNLKGKEEHKAPYCTSELELIALENFSGEKDGSRCDREHEKATERKEKEREMACRAGPGLDIPRLE